MSQPFDRGANVKAPGKIDPSIGEFWVENPWDIVSKGHNLSSYERKRLFLNLKGKDFLDLSSVSGADVDGDGRAAVAGDFNHDGKLDLVLRQVGGGPLLLFENRLPASNFLEVRLRGIKSNKLGVGAKLTAKVDDMTIYRDLYPANTFRSQAPALVHFGLGKAPRVDRLRIDWPSGLVQTIDHIPGNQAIIITEGSDKIETITPGEPIAP